MDNVLGIMQITDWRGIAILLLIRKEMKAAFTM